MEQDVTGVIGQRIDPLWHTHGDSSQCSTTGVTKVEYVLSCVCDIKDPMQLFKKSSP